MCSVMMDDFTGPEVPHGGRREVLHAKPADAERESEIVAQSGRRSADTIAANVAGRGADIIMDGTADFMARLVLREFLLPRVFLLLLSLLLLARAFTCFCDPDAPVSPSVGLEVLRVLKRGLLCHVLVILGRDDRFSSSGRLHPRWMLRAAYSQRVLLPTTGRRHLLPLSFSRCGPQCYDLSSLLNEGTPVLGQSPDHAAILKPAGVFPGIWGFVSTDGSRANEKGSKQGSQHCFSVILEDSHKLPSAHQQQQWISPCLRRMDLSTVSSLEAVDDLP